MAPVRQRLHYFDMMKGIAIFMVVMGHVITFCVREIDRTPLLKFIGEIHMPLFFFISGWMSWRSDGKAPSIPRRALQLLVPFAAVAALWSLYFPHSGLESPLDCTWSGFWNSLYKNGYWFTLVLFEVLCIYAVLVPALRRCRRVSSELMLYLAVFAVLSAIRYFFFMTHPYRYLSFGLLAMYFPVFIAGVFAHRHQSLFERACSSAGVTVSMLVGSVIIYVLCWQWEFDWADEVTLTPLRVLFHIALAVVAVAVVKPWASEAFGPDAPSGGRPVARMWAYLGKESLAIYLLHYFFLFPLGATRGILESVGLSFVPMVFFSAVVASAVIVVVLCANRILRASVLLSWLLCGRVPQIFSKNFKTIKNNA